VLCTGIRQTAVASNEEKRSKRKASVVAVLNQDHAIKTYGGVEVQLHVLFSTALDGSGPQSQSGCSGGEENIFPSLDGNRTTVVYPAA
jgi:hypothetical protein